MKLRSLPVFALLICLAGCGDDRKFAHAYMRQIELLDKKVNAAMKPIENALFDVARGLSPESAEALESARAKAARELEAIRSEFQSAVQSPHALAFGKEMHEAFTKYLDDSFRLIDADLKNITDLMFRTLAHPGEEKHQRNLSSAMQEFGRQAQDASKAVSAAQRNFGGAHGIRVNGG